MREKEEVKKKKKKRDHIRIKNDLHTIKYISKRLQLYKAHFHINFIITIVSTRDYSVSTPCPSRLG